MLSNKKGFTLTEMVVVLVILAILAAFTIPTMLGYISSSQEKLCNVTRMDMVRLYKTSLIGKETSVSKAGFEAFAKENWGSLSQCPSGGVYTFSASLGEDGQIDAEILCSVHESAHVVTSDEVIIESQSGMKGVLGFKTKSYSGSAKDIIIPNILEGITVNGIWQDLFKGKGLTSVTFENNSTITHIHTRAFQNNNLTEIVLPNSLKNLDGSAFLGNSITKITIGSNVIMEKNVFQDNDDFKTVYEKTDGSGGAGTYVYTAGQGWKKQE